MYGVVLWSDTKDKKAVIWCEDHGDLAFYNANEDAGKNLEDFSQTVASQVTAPTVFDGFSLDAGDLVQFEISEKRHLRYVLNPRLISEDEYPTLAQGLHYLAPAPEQDAPQPQTAALSSEAGNVPHTATIIPFGNAVRRRNADSDLAMTGA